MSLWPSLSVLDVVARNTSTRSSSWYRIPFTIAIASVSSISKSLLSSRFPQTAFGRLLGVRDADEATAVFFFFSHAIGPPWMGT